MLAPDKDGAPTPGTPRVAGENGNIICSLTAGTALGSILLIGSQDAGPQSCLASRHRGGLPAREPGPAPGPRGPWGRRVCPGPAVTH